MIYLLDTSTLIDLFRNFYPKQFPSLWEKFDQAVKAESIISIREVFNEIEERSDRLSEWARNNRGFFQLPTSEELGFAAICSFPFPIVGTQARAVTRQTGCGSFRDC